MSLSQIKKKKKKKARFQEAGAEPARYLGREAEQPSERTDSIFRAQGRPQATMRVNFPEVLPSSPAPAARPTPVPARGLGTRAE